MDGVITKQQEKKYLKHSGVNCISCGSYDISSGDTEIDVTGVFVSVHCNSCGFDWWDVYKLVGAVDRIS